MIKVYWNAVMGSFIIICLENWQIQLLPLNFSKREILFVKFLEDMDGAKALGWRNIFLTILWYGELTILYHTHFQQLIIQTRIVRLIFTPMGIIHSTVILGN